MTKQEIIGIINEAVPKIDTDIFGDDSKKNDNNRLGCNQLRELASLCRHSDCYEEIEMLIRYNEAKCIEEKKKGDKFDIVRKSWAAYMKDGKTSIAELICNCMKIIKERSQNEESCMQDLSLFFGYLYWNARIWAAENKAGESNYSDNRGGNNGNNNNFRNNGNKNGNQRRKW